MSIADKLTVLAASKEMVRLKLGIDEDVPFSEYGDHIGWDGITSELGQSTTTAASQKLVTDEVDKTKEREVLLQDSIAAILGINKKLTNRINALEESNISSLFNNGAINGIWLDPSDLKTMFQDAAGTEPVTKDGDPVGLILDKSQGLLLGDNTITVPPTVGNLSAYSIDSLVTDGLNIASATNESGIGGLAFELSSPVAIGEYALVTFEVTSLTGSVSSRLVRGGTGAGSSGSDPALAPKLKLGFNSAIFNITGSTAASHLQIQASGAASFSINNFKVQTIKGNHAWQPLAASRPTYRTDGELHWLEFDGVDDELAISVTLKNNSLLSAAISTDRPENSFVFGDVSGNAKIGFFSDSAFFRMVHGGDAVNIPTMQSVQHIITGFRDNGYTAGRLDGVESKASTPSATAQTTWATFGSANLTGQYFSGSIYGAILLDDYSADKLLKIENYLSTKAGVTL